MPLALFLFALVFLSSTLTASIFPGDTTEFLAASLVRGVPHAPGYPLLVLLGQAALFIPFGPDAFRLNFISVVFTAAAAAFVGIIVRDLTRSRLSGIFGAAAFLVTPVVALYGRWLETFSLHVFLVALIILIAIRFVSRPSPKLFWIGAFVFGLGMSNHHTTILLFPILATAVLIRRREILTIKNAAIAVGLSILGLLPYAALPIFAAGNPAQNWGNPTTFGALLDLFLRRDYGTTSLITETVTNQLAGSAFEFFFIDLWRQVSWLVLAASLGAIVLIADRARRTQGIILISSFLLLGPVFFLISRVPVTGIARVAILERFMIAPFLILAVLSGVGFGAIIRHRIARWLAPLVVITLLAPWRVTLAQSLFPAGEFYESISREQLRSLPAKAAYLVARDTDAMAVEYWQVRGLRPDIKVIVLGTLPSLWYRKQIIERFPDLAPAVSDIPSQTVGRLCNMMGESGKLFIADAWADGAFAETNCWPLPRGWIYELMPANAQISLEEMRAEQEMLWSDFESRWREPLIKYRPLDRRTRQLLAAMASFRRSVATVYRTAGREDWANEEEDRADFLYPN